MREALSSRSRAARPPERICRGRRRGSALLLTLVMTLALAGLATSAVYLGGSTQRLATSLDQERDLRYAAEAELAMGKSALNADPSAVPDSGYRTVQRGAQVIGADALPVPGVTADMYIGPTGSSTGQFGRFVSVVAVVRNTTGGQVVRRLELAQESFARFAYWSNQESNNGATIYFNNSDQLWGPVWSNDVIHVGSGGARFHGDVGTAQIVSGASYGTFDRGYAEHQRPITLPSTTMLAALAGYAAPGHADFTAPNANAVSGTQMRIEFVARDLDRDGRVNGADEGFFRVYAATHGSTYATASQWVRGDSTWDNCGAAYTFRTGTAPRFVPISEHRQPWLRRALTAAPSGANPGLNVSNVTSTNDATMVQAIMGMPTARCYLGGDPNLRIVELRGSARYVSDTTGAKTAATAAALDLAGNDTSFVPADAYGAWAPWPGAVDARVAAAAPAEGPYLFPLHRSLNAGATGVIYVRGTTGVSGTLRGRVTIYATGNVGVLDDLTYATDPALSRCADILGVISGNDISVADNALQDPLRIGASYRNTDDTKDVFVQGVLMALNSAFGVENYAGGPRAANGCEGLTSGRGCLYLTGGIIQQQRGAVGLSSGEGFTKRYSYDRCASHDPPPYFPATGRYADNRYYEVDPNGFSVAALFATLAPAR